MAKKTILVLADGSVYEGHSFGAEADAYGEVVFNTSMIGYQEMLREYLRTRCDEEKIFISGLEHSKNISNEKGKDE